MSCKKYQKIYGIVVFAAMSLVSVSCSDDEDAGTQKATVRFSTSASSVNEEDGTIEVQISASQASSSDVEVSFEVSGSAYLNGDYTLETTSPVILKAGEQTATIVLNLLDESIIESTDDEIKISLTSIGANALLSETSGELERTVTISDNDEVNEGELQVDLTWDLGEGVDINGVNFDLYLATNVVIEDNTVTEADLYTASEGSSGFETLWITQDDEDTEYYIVVNYTEGNVDAGFTINLNGGDSHSDEGISDIFDADDVGRAIFYGPLTKSGYSISRRKGFQRVMSTVVLAK